MKLGLYISELLREHDTVIVPGFGAFISTYKPAEFDQENEAMLPPSKEITFTQQIRNNDGLLVGFIAEHKNLSHFDALHEIERVREDMLYRLDKGERVEFEPVGFLFHRENGTIGFEPGAGENMLLDAYGLGATSLNDQEEFQDPEEIQDEPVESEPDQADSSTPDEQYDSNPEAADEPEFVPVEELDQANYQEDVQGEEPEFEPVENIDQHDSGKIQSAGKSGYAPLERPDTYPQQVRHNKNRRILLLVLILIPLISAGIYLFMRQNGDVPPENQVRVKTEVPAQQAAEPVVTENDSAAVDSASVALGVSTQDSAGIQLKPEERTGSYFLVGGSFKDEENVREYLDQLKNKGYEPFYMGKKGNFFMIGIGSFNSEREALAAQRQFLDENPGSGAWIYEETTNEVN